MKIEVTGIEDYRQRAVQRACKSFTPTRLEALRTVLGEDWIKLILDDQWIEKRKNACFAFTFSSYDAVTCQSFERSYGSKPAPTASCMA
jgi:hypothetical protein